MESGQCLHATFHPQAVLILAVTVYHSTGSDQGDGKREGAEQAGVQGARKALVGCRGNTPAGGGGGGGGGEAPQTLQNSSTCKINLWPLVASYKCLVVLFV